ncbi:MAG: hypothetical protein GY749_40020 [Desulfobacteraceae bacterium]|nr:hypothetical protein [Desulfobacteraceae bacterium]
MFKIITIPFDRNINGFNEELLNNFLLNKNIKSFRTEFFEDGSDKYWTIFLEYDHAASMRPRSKPVKTDIEEDLNEQQKLLLEKLIQWRKQTAEKEGNPAYMIGTNQEFVEIVKTTPKTLEALGAIKGFGKKKVAAYGKAILEIIKAFYDNNNLGFRLSSTQTHFAGFGLFTDWSRVPFVSRYLSRPGKSRANKTCCRRVW